MYIKTDKMTLLEDTINLVSKDPDFIKLANEAESFLQGHKWCKTIKNKWFVEGWENLVMIFYFEIIPNSKNVDDFVWVIVGDLPPAYIDIESASNPLEVIETYTDIMSDWVECVKNGLSIENCYPINVPPQKDYAEMLEIRIKLIRENILPLA